MAKSENLKKNSKENINKEKKEGTMTNTDAMIHNLMSKKDLSMNGSFIDYKNEKDSFSSINTSIYGVEQDVDDL